MKEYQSEFEIRRINDNVHQFPYFFKISNLVQVRYLNLGIFVILVFQTVSKGMTSFQPVRLAYITHEPVIETDHRLSPIIFLHGATAFKESWYEIPQVVANATKRKCYSVDARNHGDSEWSDYFNFDVNVDDLLHFMCNLRIKKAILVGHSMGGMTAVKIALRKPELVESVIVEDMGVRKFNKETVDNIRAYISLLRQSIEKAPPHDDEDEVKKFIAQYLKANVPRNLPRLYQKNEELEDTARFIALRPGPDGRFISKCNLAVLEKAMQDCETLFSQVEGIFDGPACFIYGKLSPFLVGSDEHYIKQFFPNAVFVGIEDADHSVHYRKPLEFTDALLKFLS